MKTKLYFFCLVILGLLLVYPSNLFSQNKFTEITPNEGGTLPIFKELQKLENGKIAGFFVKQISCYTYFANNQSCYVEIEMSFPEPEKIGANSYILEKYNNQSSTWENATEDGKVIELTSDYKWLKWDENTKFRLRVNGGDKDGYTSNEEEIKMPNVHTKVMNWSLDGSMWLTGVMHGNVGCGIEASVGIQLRDKKPPYEFVDGEYDDYIVYEWYRMNLHTFEKELIKGANSKMYITTEDDIGYLIVSVIRGDNVNASFFVQQESFSPIKFRNPCSVDYLGDDGLIINTYYSIPNFNKNTITLFDSENYVDMESDEAVEVIPGKYKIRIPFDFGYYDVKTNSDSWYLSPTRGEHFSQEFYFSIEEAEMKVDLVQNENPANAELELFMKRIDGDFIPYRTVQTENGKAEIKTQTGRFVLKVKEGENNLTSYFPNAAMWYDAPEIEQPMYYNSQWNDTIFRVELLSKPEPFPNTAKGVITGQISLKEEIVWQVIQLVNAFNNQTSNSVSDIDLYLHSNSSNEIVAITKSDENGNYKFENVPIGEYNILLDIIGLEMLSVITVTISNEDDVVGGASYEIGEEGIIAKTNTGIVDKKIDTIGIYPNPVKDILHITSDNPNDYVIIYNTTGSVVKKQELNNCKINVSDLNNGMYIVQVGKYKSKFLKQ